jgi:hypothetical protein
MDAFIRKYSRFLSSLMFLMMSLWALGYSVVLSRLDAGTSAATAFAHVFETENGVMNAEARKFQVTTQGAAQGIRSIPRFLMHLNRIANDTTVIIRELTPSRDAALKYEINIIADYWTFLRFAARLEALNVSINDLEVRPYNPTKTPPEHAISFSITPRNDAEELSGQRLETLAQQVASLDKRNPFQRFAYNSVDKKVDEYIELSWTGLYRLVGFAQLGEKKIATISKRENGRDYRREFSVGEELDGMTITEVKADRVVLTMKTANGLAKYVLKSRGR